MTPAIHLKNYQQICLLPLENINVPLLHFAKLGKSYKMTETCFTDTNDSQKVWSSNTKHFEETTPFLFQQTTDLSDTAHISIPQCFRHKHTAAGGAVTHFAEPGGSQLDLIIKESDAV